MTCEDVARNEIAEKYAAGLLEESEQEAFEAHFFECALCRDQLRTIQEIRADLAERPVTIRTRSIQPLWAAVAAALVVAVGIAWWQLHRPQVIQTTQQTVTPAANPEQLRSARIMELAKIQPPEYHQSTFRGGDAAQQRFADAMKSYSRKDYAAALPGLEEAVKLNPQSAAPEFFLGICDLLEGNLPAGSAHLRHVAAGDSIEAGDAHFYLAQALLAQHDEQSALAELQKAIDAKSERAADAERMIAALREMK